jgi:hypothetical protein
MWHEGQIGATESGTVYKWWAKIYDEPSEEFGLNGSRVSKLTIRKIGDTRDLFNWDRSMDKDAENDEVAAVVALVLAKFS